jgi:membrane protease YdiL (CAAX protease family)
LNGENDNFDRVEAFDATGASPVRHPEPIPAEYRKSRLSYFTLFFLLIFWPLTSIIFIGDPSSALKLMSVSPIFMVYLPTMVIQWIVFLGVYLTVWREGTGLKGLGFRKIRSIDFFWAGAFFFVSNLILAGIAVLLKLIDIEIPGELELILPKTTEERILWVFLSLTAGICEETAFRGYLITRIRMFGKTKSWVIPVILATLSFGSGHAYQGTGGFIIIGAYGAMFAILFLYTKTLWPCVIAHFFQDFSALFFPFQ